MNIALLLWDDILIELCASRIHGYYYFGSVIATRIELHILSCLAMVDRIVCSSVSDLVVVCVRNESVATVDSFCQWKSPRAQTRVYYIQ